MKLLGEMMKKTLTITLLAMSLNASAFGGWNNAPWNGGYNNNGFIAHNPYSMFSPNWFREEMDDFVDEFDNNNNNSWSNRGNHSWNNNNYNNGPWGNNFNNTPWRNTYNGNVIRGNR